MKQQEIAVSFTCKNKVRYLASLISRNNGSLASDAVGVNYIPSRSFSDFLKTLSTIFLAVVCKSS